MTDRERAERGFDASLSRSLRATHGDGAPEACPDPNILAAYAERALSADERAGWETHFADCGRCQAQLAGLARALDQTERDVLAEARRSAAAPAWRWDWRWMAPLATAAVVMVAVWVIEPGSLGERGTTPAVQMEVAEMAEKALSDRDRVEGLRARREAAAEALTAVTESTPGEPGAEADAPTPPAAARLGQRQDALARNAAGDEMARLPRQEQAAALASPTAPAPADRQLRDEADPSTAERRLAESADDRLEASAATVLIQTPSPSVQWRLAPSGLVERTTDAGASWEAQAVAPGLEPLAGSAPSGSVCWIVGRAGAIFRTTDGQAWERVTAPETVDFVAIDATDSSRAVVTSAGGTSYATSDGGRTWTPR